jgi:excisionase family DNA binding protein
MTATKPDVSAPTFYTVPEAAQMLRVDPATIYRAIRADEFPAIRVRSRYIVPAKALEQLAEQATAAGGRIDIAQVALTNQVRRATSHPLH